MSAHHRFDDDRHGHHHHPHPFDQFFFDFEHFGHHHNDHLPPTLLDATVAGNATDDHGHILNGTGNPADGWEIQNNGDFQLAADVHYRQGDTVQPVAVTADGWLVYSMPDGPQKQDSEHGVPTDNSGRAATSFDWSFDTGTHQTIQEFLASSGEFIVKIDLNPGQHNDPLVLHAVYDDTINTGGSHVVWEDSHGNVWVPDDAGTPYVTQNSQNYAFFQGLLHTSAVGPAGVFDIEEEIIARIITWSPISTPCCRSGTPACRPIATRCRSRTSTRPWPSMQPKATAQS